MCTQSYVSNSTIQVSSIKIMMAAPIIQNNIREPEKNIFFTIGGVFKVGLLNVRSVSVTDGACNKTCAEFV